MFKRKILYWSAIIVLALIGLYLLALLQTIWLNLFHLAAKVLLPFAAAAVVAYLLHPFIDMLQRKKIPRSAAILFVYAVFFGGTGWTAWYFSPVFFEQLDRLQQQLPSIFDQFYYFVSAAHRQIDMMPSAVHDSLEQAFTNTEKSITSWISGTMEHWRLIVDGALIFFLLPFLVFYILKDIDMIDSFVKKLIPPKWRDEGEILAHAVDEALGDYIRGQFIVASSVGILTIIGLWILKIPYAIVLGIFIGIMDIIPYFGPIIGAIPALAVAGTESGSALLFTLGLILLIQQLEGSVLSPYIVGRTVHLHPLVIVFALLLGFETAGIIGLLLAVPLFVAAHNVYRTFKKRKVTSKKAL
ncbi:AI-2E family transporter [Alteribacillus sp. HJP-4]|uniref:AI-2E family transporter n=1 Tax=Alteribacillus sp. HJP-4 TaxID=2775394 RepID=UPI0035CCE1B0